MTRKPERKHRVLLIDDGLEYAEILERELPELHLIGAAGKKQPKRIASGPSALTYLSRHAKNVDVVLLDMHFDLPDEQLLPLPPPASPRKTRRYQGLAILRQLKRTHPQLPVVLLTRREDISLGHEGDELGAESLTYFLDGADLATLRIRINAAVQEASMGLEDGPLLWGHDAAMRKLRRRIAVLARSSLPIILQRETGTGK